MVSTGIRGVVTTRDEANLKGKDTTIGSVAGNVHVRVEDHAKAREARNIS